MEPVRKIIHIDMDAFYASVEIRDNPRLRGLPVIVGGDPHSRGVVSTCSYEARAYGVHSGMASSRAVRLCPQAIFLRPRFDAYQEASRIIHEIFHDYTDHVEPLSLDEAYLDVTENFHGIPFAMWIAREIKRRIQVETGGLTASAGISYNMFLAKIASDMRKPDGFFVIRPHQAEQFLEKLPVGKFYGIGRVTEAALLADGIKTGLDLKRLDRQELKRRFGKSGDYYYDLVRGIEYRQVNSHREPKSLGTECTFPEDITDLHKLKETLRMKSDEVAKELERQGLAGRTVTIKVKYHDFKVVTRSHTFGNYTSSSSLIGETACGLLPATEAGTIPVRLVGVTVSGFPQKKIPEIDVRQLEFDFGDDF